MWPWGGHHVVLRGFSVDARVQGRGVGSAATSLSIRLARRLFPDAQALVLTVHVSNLAGMRVYERNGFERTGTQVTGRAGQEHVMARRLPDAEAGSGRVELELPRWPGA